MHGSTLGIVVDGLAAATAFFVELGLRLQGEGPVEGGWVDRVVGLEGVRAEIAMVKTTDGHGPLELTKFHAASGRGGDRHAPANTRGIRHVAFGVDDIDAVVASSRARARSSLQRRAPRRQLSALLRPRPAGNHRRAGRADRLRLPPAANRLARVSRRPREDPNWDGRGNTVPLGSPTPTTAKRRAGVHWTALRRSASVSRGGRAPAFCEIDRRERYAAERGSTDSIAIAQSPQVRQAGLPLPGPPWSVRRPTTGCDAVGTGRAVTLPRPRLS